MKYNTQNAKIKSITEKTLIVGIDVGSETHFARAFDWRNYEYSKKPLEFSNTEAGFMTLKAWMADFAEKYGTRKLSFASENDLMDILGLIKGAVTPFGLLNDTDHCVKFYLNSDFKNGILGIHPNDNTATVSMKTEDLVSLLADKGYETEWIDILS